MFAIDSDRRPPVPAEGRRPVAPRTLFALALIAYVVVIAVFGRFASFDEIFYKAAGYHLAVDGHFAAPELIGRLPFNPPIEKVFACYPPLYPFVFGVYTKVVGFGPVRVALFDVWIHVILCIQSAALAWHFAAPAAAKPSRRAWVSALVGTALIPLGTPGRPDELAIVFGTAGLLALVVPVRPVVNVRRSLFVGIMAGLCAGTSIFAAATLGLIAVGLIVARRGQTLREKIRVFLWMLPAAGVVLALCFAAAAVGRRPRLAAAFRPRDEQRKRHDQ